MELLLMKAYHNLSLKSIPNFLFRKICRKECYEEFRDKSIVVTRTGCNIKRRAIYNNATKMQYLYIKISTHPQRRWVNFFFILNCLKYSIQLLYFL